MAFAFGFPQDVTDLMYSMRDWRWEMVRNGGKTPSAQCFNIGVPGIRDNPYDKPLLLPMAIPYYHVESDSEDSDFGEIVLDHWNKENTSWNVGVKIERYYPAGSFTLREYGGRVPAKFRRLQKQRDRRVNEMWFECEPCEPANAL